MTSEKIWLRTEILGTQVITRNTGKRLGVVSELKVDIDRREVVALGLRDNMLTRLIPGGISKYMLLESIRQIGDVILVDDENIIVDVDPEEYSNLINCEVVTETQELLGRVRNFKFDVETGKISALIIASIGLPLVPEQVVSTYELDVEEIVTNGPDRIIVFEGAEERLN
jgi:sporulation protein YlmC with PRC-barrel domain